MNFYFRNMQIICWYTHINVMLKTHEGNLPYFINKTSQLRKWKNVNMVGDWKLGIRLELVDNLPIRWFIDLPMNSRPDCPLKIRGQVLPPGSTGVMIFLHFRLLHFFLKLSIVNYQLSIISPTSSHHRGTRSAQRACRQAKDKLFEPPQGGELFVF